ncbi:uncharacterized protein FTOL_13470 [Fusarium torulosum]|uniref:Uncharacterized protein n=1 Tax=Fusarium torulosum TaxID=33205 RepID=A0AAE8SQA5_9HYPO|nr:uncharacterized protein FTOL_13470 [Fusarium torulosum]
MLANIICLVDFSALAMAASQPPDSGRDEDNNGDRSAQMARVKDLRGKGLNRNPNTVSPTGMRMNIDTKAGCEFEGARVAYLAYPDGSDADKGGSTNFRPGQDGRKTEWPRGHF